jgi:hypothetical protein
MGLERAVDEGVRNFNKVKSAIEEFYVQHQEVIDRYEITAHPGIAASAGYYIALNSHMGKIDWDRLGLPECYQDIPVAVRKR